MDLSSKSRLLFVYKIVVVAIVVFLGLTRKTEEVGYRLADVPQENFLSQSGVIYSSVLLSSGDALVQDVVQTLYPEVHNLWADTEDMVFAEKFQYICDENSDLCSKITFIWEISAKDKYVYFSLIVYVVDAINNLLASQFDSLDDVLESIDINTVGWLRRGGADWHNITINTQIIWSYEEFLEVLTHEIWHVIDLWVIQWVSRSKNFDYTEFGAVQFAADDWSIDFYALSWKDEYKRHALSYSSDFCSGYGMSNPFEDFAECLNLYLNHNALFRFWAANNAALEKKYNLFAALFDNSYLFAGSKDLALIKNYDSDWRPWDTTRIKY
jgi:hypothetical protein